MLIDPFKPLKLPFGQSLIELHDGADFDGVAHRGAGDFGGPGYGLVQDCGVDGVVAAQGLFSFGVGASVVTVLPSCPRTTVAAWVGWRASPQSILPDAWKSAVKLL